MPLERPLVGRSVSKPDGPYTALLSPTHAVRAAFYRTNQTKGDTTGLWAVCQAASSSSMRLVR